jgi:magnesium transporter
VDSAAYAGGRRVADVSLDDTSEVLKQPDRFAWIGLHEPDGGLLHEVQPAHGPAEPRHAAALPRQGPGLRAYAIMDFIVDRYFPLVEAPEDQLEALEEEIFGRRFDRAPTAKIYRLKRDLVEVKRAAAPVADICNRLVRFDLPLLPEGTRPYFRDVYDHALRISVAQNEAMKRPAGRAAIIAAPTMIAGVSGMNFQWMPELEWPLGYSVVMAR